MRRQDKKEDGYTLFIIASVLVVFLGFTALSVDVGVLYSARASAQRAADAAALAGAFVFITRPNLSETTTPKQSDVIKENAIKTAATNKMLGAAVTITDSDVVLDTTNLDANNQMINRRVTVNVNQSQPTLFARILGENSANIHATAVAEAARNATANKCTKPWFLPNTILSSKALCGSGGWPTTNGACTSTPKELLIDPADPLHVTQFAKDWMAAQDALPSTSNPRRFTIKPSNGGGGSTGPIAPGEYFAVRLGDSSGGSDYKTNIKTCTAETIACGVSYGTEPGAKIGPTKQGACGLICYDGSENCSGCQKDTYVSPGLYKRPDLTNTTTSRSLVIAPIIDVCQYCPNSFPTGTSTLQVIGFALVFIEDIDANNVLARLIDVTACTGGGGEINPEETGSFSLPIRLVRVP
jgi:Flp pilus assembly protein TadG